MAAEKWVEARHGEEGGGGSGGVSAQQMEQLLGSGLRQDRIVAQQLVRMLEAYTERESANRRRKSDSSGDHTLRRSERHLNNDTERVAPVPRLVSQKNGFAESIRPKISRRHGDARPITCPAEMQRLESELGAESFRGRVEETPRGERLIKPSRPATTAAISRPIPTRDSSASPPKPAKKAFGVYGGSARRLSSTRKERRMSDAERKNAHTWRAKQLARIEAAKARKEEERAMIQAEMEAEAKRMAMLKATLKFEAVAPRYKNAKQKQPSAEQREAAREREHEESVRKAAALETATAAERKREAAERAALNRAIRLRQEEFLAQKAKEREQDLLNAQRILARREEAQKAAHKAVMDDIAAFRQAELLDGGLDRRKRRLDAKERGAAESAHQRAVALQDRKGNGSPDKDDGARWRKRFGVDGGTPVFITDGYGEPVAKKLLARGWAQNTSPGSSVCNLIFVRRNDAVPYTVLASGQIANHFRGSDLLTTKSGLHQCMLGLTTANGGAACHPSTFYPRSYYFAERVDQQMLTFIEDFKDGSAIALLWMATVSTDGYLGRDPERLVAMEPDTLEMALSHIRWRLCHLRDWAAAEVLDGLAAEYAAETKAVGRQRPVSAAPSATSSLSDTSPLTEYQWSCVSALMELLVGVLEIDPSIGLPDLPRLEAQLNGGHVPNGCSPAWQAMRRRAVFALRRLLAADPQACINGPANVWVVKPCGAARGHGVKVLADVGRVLAELQTGPPRIVQKYVERPLLLGERKADLRVWVLVLSFRPLIAYVYDQVMVRPATQRYSLAPNQLANVAVHLCNHSLQSALVTASSSSSNRSSRPSTQQNGANSRISAVGRHRSAPLVSSSGGMAKVGEVVATIEDGKVKYVPLADADTSLSSSLHADPEDPDCEAQHRMLSLRALLPYIAAVAGEAQPSEALPGWKPSAALRALIAEAEDPAKPTDSKCENTSTPLVLSGDSVSHTEGCACCSTSNAPSAIAPRAASASYVCRAAGLQGNAAREDYTEDNSVRGDLQTEAEVMTQQNEMKGKSISNVWSNGMFTSATGVQEPRSSSTGISHDSVATTEQSKVESGIDAVGEAGVASGPKLSRLKSGVGVWANGMRPIARCEQIACGASGEENTRSSSEAPLHHALAHMQRLQQAETMLEKEEVRLQGTSVTSPRRRSSAAPKRSEYAQRMDEAQGEEGAGWESWKRTYWPAIQEATAAALVGAAPGIMQEWSAIRGRCFELYGFDFLLDGDGERAWLLEVNESPDLRAHSMEKSRACSDMLEDLVELVTAHVTPPQADASQRGHGQALLSAWEDPPSAAGGWTKLSAPQECSGTDKLVNTGSPSNKFSVEGRGKRAARVKANSVVDDQSTTRRRAGN